MSESKKRGCLKSGCLGCLSLVAIGIILLLLFLGLQLTVDSEPKPEQRSLSQSLPKPPPLSAPTPDGDPADAPDAPAAPGASPRELSPIPGSVDLGDPPLGRIELDVGYGDFEIRPGRPDEPLRVEADFDTAAFELVESYDQTESGDWVYGLRFRPRGGWFGAALRGGDQGRNEVTLIIPRGHRLLLTGRIGVGESRTDLGGLWVEAVDLDYGTGDHFLEFSDPLPVPMQSFAVDSSIGQFEVRSLGNASPMQVQADHGIGEMYLDLRGPWRNDAEMQIQMGIGEARIEVPREVRVALERRTVSLGEAYGDLVDPSELPADAPELAINARSRLGELVVRQ